MFVGVASHMTPIAAKAAEETYQTGVDRLAV